MKLLIHSEVQRLHPWSLFRQWFVTVQRQAIVYRLDSRNKFQWDFNINKIKCRRFHPQMLPILFLFQCVKGKFYVSLRRWLSQGKLERVKCAVHTRHSIWLVIWSSMLLHFCYRHLHSTWETGSHPSLRRTLQRYLRLDMYSSFVANPVSLCTLSQTNRTNRKTHYLTWYHSQKYLNHKAPANHSHALC